MLTPLLIGLWINPQVTVAVTALIVALGCVFGKCLEDHPACQPPEAENPEEISA